MADHKVTLSEETSIPVDVAAAAVAQVAEEDEVVLRQVALTKQTGLTNSEVER
jgi:hypothetical protein